MLVISNNHIVSVYLDQVEWRLFEYIECMWYCLRHKDGVRSRDYLLAM